LPRPPYRNTMIVVRPVGLQTPIPNYTREGMRRRVSLEYLGYLRLYPTQPGGGGGNDGKRGRTADADGQGTPWPQYGG
jgi:hypothetical protein